MNIIKKSKKKSNSKLPSKASFVELVFEIDDLKQNILFR